MQREKFPCLLLSCVKFAPCHLLSSLWQLSPLLFSPSGNIFAAHVALFFCSMGIQLGRGQAAKSRQRTAPVEALACGEESFGMAAASTEWVCEGLGTQHPPSFPPVAPEPGFCSEQCPDQSCEVCTMNYLCQVIIVMSRHSCLNTAPSLLMEKKDLFPKQIFFLNF